jgi:hypothetical protein
VLPIKSQYGIPAPFLFSFACRVVIFRNLVELELHLPPYGLENECSFFKKSAAC